MLHLAAPTDPGWFDRVSQHLDVILLDHAHLEKRAGSTALAMIFRYAHDHPRLGRVLAEIVQEEMDHYARMLDLLQERGIAYERLTPAAYAGELVAEVRREEPQALLDKLLVAALIEARSCERFQILAARVDDPALAAFYQELYVCEARHHTTYTDLARRIFDAEVVAPRLDERATREVEALRACGGAPRLHAW